jgi:hypothetical protein
VALGEREGRLDRQAAEHRRLAGGGLAQQIEVRAAADPVADDARELERRVERGEAPRQRGDAARHPGGVADQHGRRGEPPGDLGGRALIAGRRHAIVEAHHALDQRDVGAARRAGERRGDRLATHHPAVEVVARGTGGARVVGRVQVVRAALEHGDPQAPRPERAHQPDGDGGLADAARDARDDEPRHHQ